MGLPEPEYCGLKEEKLNPAAESLWRVETTHSAATGVRAAYRDASSATRRFHGKAGKRPLHEAFWPHLCSIQHPDVRVCRAGRHNRSSGP